jgi:D-alanine-D-alanine ligase
MDRIRCFSAVRAGGTPTPRGKGVARVRVAVLFNQAVLPHDHPEADSEEWVRTAADDIAGTLTAAGNTVSRVGVGRDLNALAEQLAVCRPDIVFNLFEGHADRPATEVAVARLLERLSIPFTGSPSQTLRWTLCKHRTKRRLQQAGLPTPWWRVVRRPPPTDGAFPWPVIVKPTRRDASEGIDQRNVVTDPAALARRVAELLEQYGPSVLIEQFLPGREFTVSLIEVPELKPLPVAEVQFTPTAAAPWPILSYAAKWLPGTAEYEATEMQNAAPLSPELSGTLITLAQRAFRTAGCRDYARIDLRMTAAGEPMILEVNANPDMSPTACFAGALAAAGMERANLLVRLAHQAAGRRQVPITCCPLVEKE